MFTGLSQCVRACMHAFQVLCLRVPEWGPKGGNSSRGECPKHARACRRLSSGLALCNVIIYVCIYIFKSFFGCRGPLDWTD